eukprot:685365_1
MNFLRLYWELSNAGSLIYHLMLGDSVSSPLSQSPHYISHFKLLYYAIDEDLVHFATYLKASCVNIPSLLMILETQFDHIFAFYLGTPITIDPNPRNALQAHKSIYSDQCGFYLIQSKFAESLTTKTWPRTIRHTSTPSQKLRAFTIQRGLITLGSLMMMGGRVSNGKALVVRPIESLYDSVGNEVIGGPVFDNDKNLNKISTSAPNQAEQPKRIL